MNERNWRFWLAPLLVPTILMLPVLWSPHYGLFSDAGQIIEFPREVLAGFPESLKLLRPLEDGRWNPLFHGLSILIYALAPDSARAFYIAQWLMLVVTCVSLAWIVVRVTANAVLAWLSVFLFCTASSVFENFYTLDKVEPRVALFSSLLVVLFVSQYSARVSDGDVRSTWRAMLVQMFLGVAVVFSKETGVFLAASFFATWLATLLNPSWGKALSKLAFEFFLVQLIVVVVYFGLFKALAPPMSYRYVVYDISPSLVLRNASYYLRSSPELALGIFSSIYWLARIVFAKSPGGDSKVRFLSSFFSFALLAYFSGICLWRWPLDYYLLPAHLFSSLLIALTIWTAIPFFRYGLRRPAKFGAGALCIVWVAYCVYRVFLGSAIFAFDAAKDDLAHRLSSPDFYGKRLIVPMGHPDSAEVGERLEFFINRARPANQAVDLYNFWEFPSETRRNLTRFSGAAGIAPGSAQLRRAADDADRIVIWKFGENEQAYLDEIKRNVDGLTSAEIEAERSSVWHLGFVRPGDLIVAPVGSRFLRRMSARGLGMHTESSEEFVQKTPLVLKSVPSVTRGLGPVRIGWEVYEVVSLIIPGKGGYSTFTLKRLNKLSDISENTSVEALFRDNRLPEAAILVGTGWYDLEEQGGAAFRWMGSESEVVLTRLPAGKCVLDLDVEPILDASAKAFELSLIMGDRSQDWQLSGREHIAFEFDSDGEEIQVLKLHTAGGMEGRPKNDTRYLKMRAFKLGAPHCAGEVK